MLKTIITNFDKAQDLFILLIPSRHTDGSSFNKALDYLTEKKNLKDDKHIKCLLVLIKHLRKVSIYFYSNQTFFNSFFNYLSIKSHVNYYKTSKLIFNNYVSRCYHELQHQTKIIRYIWKF